MPLHVRPLWAILALLFSSLSATAEPAGKIVIVPHVQKSVAVLLFHQIDDHPIESAHGVDHIQKPWTTPAAFDALLTELQRKGFTVIRLRTALDYFEGKISAKSLPTKPVLLTFDDGYLSAWTHGTPILMKHHATATMFFEGHATNNPAIPGRLDSAQLRAMASSGVWTLESHGWAGHSDLQISASGTLSPYWYANLAWLPDKHRFETPLEFEARLQSDLSRMRSAFEADTGHPLTIFAYPSGEFGQNPPLAPGVDPMTSIEAGHSNAAGLTPYVLHALRASGYEAAFAVSLPESAHLASPSDNIYELPRIGVGATFQLSFLEGLAAHTGLEFPEIADGRVADAGPLCVSQGFRFVAATNRPVIFRLDRAGHRLNATNVPQLTAGRPSGSANISGLSCNATTLWAVQQAGFDPNPQPWLDRFSIGADGTLDLRERTALPPVLNWLVGIALDDGMLYGITDRGRLYDLQTFRSLGDVDGAARTNDAFAGLASRDGLLYSLHRAEHQLVAFTPSGSVVARAPVDPQMRDLAFDENHLLLSHWTRNRRSMQTYDIVELPQ